MNSKTIISLEETSRYCYKILSTGKSMDEVLSSICQYLIRAFGNYISPGKLSFFNEMKINFIELLDQIIYEYRENTNYDPSIKDYIITDLYSRLSLILEAYNSSEMYMKNIKQRALYPDDLIIIREMGLKELISFILEEWDETTNLHKPAIKTLLYFAKGHFNDFMEIHQNTYSKYVKAAASLGMRYDFPNAPAGTVLSNIMCSEYFWKFNLKNITENRLPKTPDELVFTLLHLEREIDLIADNYDYLWIFRFLSDVPDMEIKNSWSVEIYSSLTSLFIKLDCNRLCKIINSEDQIVSFIKFIDYLPRNYFNRITGKLDEMGRDFHFKINSIIEKGKIDISETNSNMFNYICWNSVERI